MVPETLPGLILLITHISNIMKKVFALLGIYPKDTDAVKRRDTCTSSNGHNDILPHTSENGENEQDRKQQMLERMWRKGNPPACWWGCKLVQPLWKTVWRFLKELKIDLPYTQQLYCWGFTPKIQME